MLFLGMLNESTITNNQDNVKLNINYIDININKTQISFTGLCLGESKQASPGLAKPEY